MALRSPGWSVRPSFVPHGPTTGVTLLADDVGLTQLAGVPDVAWQTPWAALSAVQLVRYSRSMELSATAAGVRFAWRNASLADYEAWREAVLAHGGDVARRPRRLGVLVVVAVVLVASLGGALASLLTGSGPGASSALAGARAANLRLDDLPAGFATTSASFLEALFGTPGKVVTPSPTTQPSASSQWGKISAIFQGCEGVSAARDRVFGAAGQQPDFQVTSPIFRGAVDGGVDVASTSQYYATTSMVRRDVAEMSQPAFGSCFAAVNAAMVLTYVTGAVPRVAPGSAWRPVTFVPGWSRGGEIRVTIPGVGQPLYLVIAVVAGGHHEVTLTALVGEWPQARDLMAGLVNTIKSRIASPTSTAA